MKKFLIVTSLFSLFFISASTFPPLIIAHRGGGGQAPENTMTAYKKALTCGATWIELDVHLSEDHVVVISHDHYLNIDNDHLCAICKLPLEEIKNLDAGKWFSPSFQNEKIPTLEEFLQIDRGNLGVMIEVKSYPKEESILLTKKIIGLLKQYPQKAPVIIGSFNLDTLKYFQQLAPNLPLIGICHFDHEAWMFIASGIKHIALCHCYLNENKVKRMIKEGVCIWCFTVNDPIRASKLYQMGVSGLITDYPSEISKEF